jgi:hypothetical protein
MRPISGIVMPATYRFEAIVFLDESDVANEALAAYVEQRQASSPSSWNPATRCRWE